MLRIYVKTPADPVSFAYSDLLRYSLLYNFHVITDERLLSSSDDWEVPEQSDWASLITYLTSAVAGQKLKESGLTYWNTPNSGTNIFNFNGRGSGKRAASFGLIKESCFLYSRTLNSNRPVVYSLNYDDSFLTFGIQDLKIDGNSIRLFRDATTPELSLPDGLIQSDYIGNDLKTYRCIKIGTQIWLSKHLAETKYRNGDWITGFDAGTYTPISNAAWAALTTEALCAYNDDLNNV